MWKRAEEAPREVAPLNQIADHTEQQFNPTPTIGRNTLLKGEISGRDDLWIQGRLEGCVSCPESSVTICRSGIVFGNIRGRIVHVEGEVNGDILGAEKVSIAKTGTVFGNITAPTVSLDEGAKLKGMIDMEPEKDLATTIEFLPDPLAEVELAQHSLVELHVAPKLANGSGY